MSGAVLAPQLRPATVTSEHASEAPVPAEAEERAIGRLTAGPRVQQRFRAATRLHADVAAAPGYAADQLAVYDLIESIVVDAGRDTYLDLPVAVKLFRDDVEFDAVFREARVQATGEHQHVVTIRNVVVEPSRRYVVMDLAEGPVEQRLDAGVSLIDAVRWTRDGLAGLAHIHSLGIVHRCPAPA